MMSIIPTLTEKPIVAATSSNDSSDDSRSFDASSAALRKPPSTLWE